MMNWKTKRAVGTALAAVVPYLGMAFVGWSFVWPMATVDARLCLLATTSFMSFAAYTYPGWRW